MRILAVDDEPVILRLLVRLMPEHEVHCYDDGCEAIDHLKEGHEYDVVICDVLLPDCNGIDLYRTMAKERPHLARRILFLTGGIGIPAISEFLDSLPNIRLEKPFKDYGLRVAVLEASLR